MKRFAPYAAAAAAGLIAVGVSNPPQLGSSCTTPVTTLGEATPVVDALNAYMIDKIAADPKLNAKNKAVADYQIYSGGFQDVKGNPSAVRVELTIVLYRGDLDPVPYIAVLERDCAGGTWTVTKLTQLKQA